MSMETTLVVLAAGIGRRYGGLKQLESVGPNGEALLEYSIFDALRAGFDRVVLVIRPETEAEFREFLEGRLADHVDLSYAYQTTSDVPQGIISTSDRTKPWGTGQAVLVTEPEVHGPFAVINADDFYGANSFEVLGEFLKSNHSDRVPIFALAGFKVGPTLSDAGPVSRGLCRADSEGWLERIVEVLELSKQGSGGHYIDEAGVERAVSAGELVSMNMWGFSPVVFANLRERFEQFLCELEPGTRDSVEFMLPDVIQEIIDCGSGRVQVLRHDGRWCGITFPEDKQSVRDFLAGLVARGEYPQRLWV